MIPFIDLAAQRRRLGGRIEAAVARVVEQGAYIMGPEVKALEERMAAHVGVKHAITCGSGAQALELVLRAWAIGPGDAVITPAFTFAATGEAPALVGATPVFADVDPRTFNLTPATLEAGVAAAKAAGLRPRAVIPVDLFGQPADYAALESVAAAHDLLVLQDAAQSYGAHRGNKRAGAHGHAGATSFYPAKPLGCYGDGGAVYTDDDGLAEIVRSIRFHGMGGGGQYDNVRVGMTGRLDTIQAAVLLEKLAIFEEELATRQRVARRYDDGLRDVCTIPLIEPTVVSAWAQYTVLVADRPRVQAALKAEGVPTMVYYPKPLSSQLAFADCPMAEGGVPVSLKLAAEVMSLPMHPYLDEATQARIIACVRAALVG